MSTAYQLAKRGKKTLLIEKVFFAFLDVVIIVLILNHILILSWKDKSYKMKKKIFFSFPFLILVAALMASPEESAGPILTLT